MNRVKIFNIVKGSIAEKEGLLPGDKIISINGSEINDILDYNFLVSDEEIEIEIERDGEEYICEIYNPELENIGIVFENELIDCAKKCANKCIFCFMDQLPKKVRPTLIFKDDDYRLSFFTGNYITMTNMSMRDIDRIIAYHLSPINISIHATDSAVREKMLNNKNAGKILSYIQKLYDNKTKMNGQIVLCKGVNDGNILDKTMDDLSRYYPYMQSVSIVPVGITKYREGLYNLEPFNKEDCRNIIKQVTKKQTEFKKKYGSNIIYLADEFYTKAEIDLPDYLEYEDLYQLENGVGMIANFEYEFSSELDKITNENKEIDVKNKKVSIATGKSAYKYICNVSRRLMEKVNGFEIKVYEIGNRYFGENITVTGLLTGSDIIDQLKEKDLGEKLYICDSMLKDDEDIFLDDLTLEEVKEKLKIDIIPIINNGEVFVQEMIKR